MIRGTYSSSNSGNSGGCSTGGCNKFNVFNWLADIPASDFGKPFNIIEVSFDNGSRKDYFLNTSYHTYFKGDFVAVEGSGGYDVGEISLQGELVKFQLKKYKIKEETVDKKILRLASENDLSSYHQYKGKEKETLVRSRAIVKEVGLDMKVSHIEWQADGKKMTVFYTAETRVDFRELIKVLASEFKTKVEMRQIGARQESAKLGGIGSCGRELCCSTWLTDFKAVSTSAARYQNLSINQSKLSGQCGRLKCCLNFELDTYLDALKHFPKNAETLLFSRGKASLQKKDIFKNLMWYSFEGSSKQYPLTIEKVKEVQELNAKGEKPEEFEAAEIKINRPNVAATIDMGFVNDVGQIQLSSLRGNKKKKNTKPSATASKNRNGEFKTVNKNQSNVKQNPEGNLQKNQERKAQQQKNPTDSNAQKPSERVLQESRPAKAQQHIYSGEQSNQRSQKPKFYKNRNNRNDAKHPKTSNNNNQS
ncbi:MAG TPA: regulatory iron-sulfur-containing complex subunit RicT [Edaphocola sp.]|nr:regulatory iron-sulfur-containing complex subunit RicT [Edaphocola sp.]